MRKISKAQEMVLRQISRGQVRLVYVGDNDHSVRMWDAIGSGGRKYNRQYDALHKAGLIWTEFTNETMWVERVTSLTIAGDELLAAMGPAGVLVISDFAPGTGDRWSIRFEKGENQPYILYLNGRVYDRYSRQESIYTVYRSHCPYVNDLEASMSR